MMRWIESKFLFSLFLEIQIFSFRNFFLFFCVKFGNELHDTVPIEKHLDHLHLACDDNSTTKRDLTPDYCLLNEHSALSLYELYFMLQEFTRLATTIDEKYLYRSSFCSKIIFLSLSFK